MAIAGSSGSEADASGGEFAAEDFDLLDHLEVEGDDSGDDKSSGGEDEAAAKAASDKAAADEAKAAEAEAKAAEAKAAKESKKGAAGDDEGDDKWYAESVKDDKLIKIADQFESQDAMLDQLGALQKALGIEPIKDWREGITDKALQEHARRFNSPVDLVKGNVDLRNKLSTALVFPGKGATKEEKTAFAGKLSKMLGVPEKPEDYSFPAMPDGAEAPEDVKAAEVEWGKFFHSIHLPKSQADAILAKFAEETATGQQSLADEDERFAEKATDELKSEWGDDWDVNRRAADTAARELFGEDLVHVMSAEMGNGRLLMDSPFMLRALSRIGREMSEGSMDVLTDSEKETVDDQVKDLRKRAAEAKESGNTREANRLFKQEQEALAKLVGKTPIVGAGDRTA